MSENVILNTNIPGLTPFIKGKVRDVYDLDTHLLVVTTDRISAFDVVLPTGIPAKCSVLNGLSAFWFQQMRETCPNHLVTTDVDRIAEALRPRAANVPKEMLAGRSMLVHKAQALPVECVVRGYLDGSGWKSY